MAWSGRLASRVIDQMADAVMVVDLYGRIVEVNPELCRRVGFTREQLIGASPSLWHGAEAQYGELAQRIISECLRDGRWLGHVEFQSTSGQLRLSEVLVTPLHDEDGEVTAVLSVGRDITDRAAAPRVPEPR